MGEKSIIIIGAGIAGLSAGCYAQMNGYRTRIFEMHTIPGGLCTSWKRKGYTIDGCIETWMGTSPGTDFYNFWEELGAIQGREIVYQEEYSRVEGEGGEVLILHIDPDRLETHLKEVAPEDEAVVDELVGGIRACLKIKGLPLSKAPEVMGPVDGLKTLLAMSAFQKLRKTWGRISIQDFAQRFKNPFLREAFPHNGSPPAMPMLGFLMSIALTHNQQSGYPVGGSLAVSQAIEQRYRSLGGEVQYRSAVEKVLVAGNRAVGIQLEDGTEHRGDVVISAADGRSTIFGMLDGRYASDKIRRTYEATRPLAPLVYVGLGVARTFDEPHSAFGLNFPVGKPVVINGTEESRLQVHIYGFDPTLAPEGKTALRVKLMDADYDYWNTLRENPERYRAEKERIADDVIVQLDRRFPGLAAQVEMRDVSTPVTFERYTGNWRGSWMGWELTPETADLRMSKTLPGLGSFYMIGQWVDPPGGTCVMAMSGRNVVQIICKKDKKKFVTATP